MLAQLKVVLQNYGGQKHRIIVDAWFIEGLLASLLGASSY